MPPKKTSWQDLVAKAVSSQNAKRASLRPEWRRLGDQRKIDLVVKLNGCRGDDEGVAAAEVLSTNSASFVKFMSKQDDSFLLHCLTACIDTGCASEKVLYLIDFCNFPWNVLFIHRVHGEPSGLGPGLG